jgi:threonine dehydratase/serine racemase
MSGYAVNLGDIEGAARRIEPWIHCTPLLRCRSIDAQAGLEIFLKCENLQKVGAFKIRGATNAVLQLDEAQARRGVVTHSSGNHAQALALAARNRGIPAHIVMPTNAPSVKRLAAEGYGATIHECEPTLAARERRAQEVMESTGATMVPPYDHPWVIAGQGTMGLEILAQIDAVDAIVAPVGGGGMTSGIALALHERAPEIAVIAAEPSGADDAARSKAAGRWLPQEHPRTIADGLRTSLGRLTWPIVRDLVERVLTVDDRSILGAMRLLFERAKLVVEPSGAVALAAVLSDEFRELSIERGIRRVAVVLSGGNVDLSALFGAMSAHD